MAYFFHLTWMINPHILLIIASSPKQTADIEAAITQGVKGIVISPNELEIMECEILPNGERVYRTIFQYVITENRMEDGKFIIDGHPEQRASISDSLSKRLLENGMPIAQIQSLKSEVKTA